jgi:hypothetical protein
VYISMNLWKAGMDRGGFVIYARRARSWRRMGTNEPLYNTYFPMYSAVFLTRSELLKSLLMVLVMGIFQHLRIQGATVRPAPVHTLFSGPECLLNT